MWVHRLKTAAIRCMGGFVSMLVLAVPPAAFAGTVVPAPEGPVILRVTGRIDATQAGSAAEEDVIAFDFQMLERLPWTTLTSFTAWTEGAQRFEGVLLRDLLEYVEVTGSEIKAVALNDYAAILPVSDAKAFDVLLAMRMNGEAMRVRDKGPVWIIYPEVSQQDVNFWPHNERMVWQLKTLEIR